MKKYKVPVNVPHLIGNEKKQVIFQIWNWGYEFVDRQLCKYCNGRVYIIFKRKYEQLSSYQSFMEH